MIRTLVFAAFALAAVGCSQLGSMSGDPRAEQLWNARQQAAAEFDNWDLRARAALRLKGEAYNINLSWKRAPDRFSILLEAPFGQGVFRITSGSDGVYRLHLPDGQQIVNSTPEALLEDAVGWSLPIDGLEYWIRGMPQPGGNYFRRIDAEGRARTISQDRWDISYTDYFDTEPEPQLPRRIKLAREELSLKLVIEHWQPDPGEQAPSDLFPEFN